MTKKIETEKDIEENLGRDIEIEFLSDASKKNQKKRTSAVEQYEKSDKTLKTKLKKMEEELEEIKQEMANLRDEYLRTVAEKDNLRKRLEREKNDFFQFALSDQLKEFLVILDNFERALDSQQENPESLRSGIELIYKQFLDLLKKQGVQPILNEGGAFDPRFHQAFLSQDSEEVTEPTVSEEFQKGYMLHDRLLRPALVKVLLPIKKTAKGKE